MSNSTAVFTGSAFPQNPLTLQTSGLPALKAAKALQRIHDRMRKQVFLALADQKEANFQYRMRVRDGALASIDYRLVGADAESRHEIDKIVSDAVMEGARAQSSDSIGREIVQWVRLAVSHQSCLGVIDDK